MDCQAREVLERVILDNETAQALEWQCMGLKRLMSSLRYNYRQESEKEHP